MGLRIMFLVMTGSDWEKADRAVDEEMKALFGFQYKILADYIIGADGVKRRRGVCAGGLKRRGGVCGGIHR